MVLWCLYTLFINDTECIKANCNYEVNPQTHNVEFNFTELYFQLVLRSLKIQI